MYAWAYHDLYMAIKGWDPTARVSAGGIIQATPLRLQYMDRVWDEYQSRYGERMPVDVWNIHAFVLREGRNSWGADIPAGIDVQTGIWYSIADNKNFNIAAGHIHRYQILFHPLRTACSFVYPGSIQRMSFAEMYEEKGFIEGEILNGRFETRFLPLPCFDMEIVQIDAAGLSPAECENEILNQSWRMSEDLVIRFNLTGGKRLGDYATLDYKKIRDKMPPALESQFAVKTANRWVMR